MASYSLTREAESDLDQIYAYGILNYGLKQAREYLRGIESRFNEIADNPYQWQAVDHIRLGVRRSVYKSISIYYRTRGDDVLILAVIGQQDVTVWL